MSAVRAREWGWGAGAGMRGLSLVELMVALLIGTMLMLGVVQIFSASHSAYQLSEGIARTQENGRFALDYLQRDLRMVGHLGCANDQARIQQDSVTLSNLLVTNDRPALRFEQPIQGYEAATTGTGSTLELTTPPSVAQETYSPALPTQYANALSNRVDGSDIVALRFLVAQGAAITTVGGTTTAPLFHFDAKRFSVLRDGVDDPGLFGVADCASASVFQARAVDKNNGTVTSGAAPSNLSPLTFGFSYEAGQTTLYRAESLVYYVGTNASGGTSLYRVRFSAKPGQELTATQEELVEGVRNLQILYGQDSVADPAQPPTGYISTLRTADEIESSVSRQSAAGWRRVGSVQLGLLLSSPDPATAASSKQALNMLGVSFKVQPDGRYRTIYQTTVALRNRLYGN